MSIILDKIEVSYIKEQKSSDIWAKYIRLDTHKKLNIFAVSGSGKTSLFNVITAIQKPFKGHVLINGKDVHSIKKEGLVELRKGIISLVFQDLKLIPSLTVLENISILTPQINSKQSQKLDHMMKRLSILDKKEEPLTSLSQGEKQRVAIIRSLFRPYKYLIMDEPFSHLDKSNKIEAIKLIEEETLYNKAGIVILSLHKEELIDWDMQVGL